MQVRRHLRYSEADEGDVREQLVVVPEGGDAEPDCVRRSEGSEGVRFMQNLGNL